MKNTITALKQQKGNRQRVNIYLDGEFAFGLARILAAWLEIGQQLSAKKISELQEQDAIEVAYQRGLKFLSYRPRSTAEVRRNLRKHKVPEETIEATIERLQEKRFLDDSDFAQRWVENRNTFRPRGRFALRTELRQKGLSDAIIEEALQDLDEEKLGRQAAEKKMGKMGDLDWIDFRKKLSAHLARRGFSYELIAEVCKESWKRLKQAEVQNNTKQEMRF